MTAVDYLRQHGECSAQFLAAAIGERLDAVYAQLIHAECLGLVRVNCYGHTRRTWEAM